VFTPSDRPNVTPAARASRLRWLKTAPMITVGNPNASSAGAASAASAAAIPSPNKRTAIVFITSAPHRLAAPSRHAAASAASSAWPTPSGAGVLRPPARWSERRRQR